MWMWGMVIEHLWTVQSICCGAGGREGGLPPEAISWVSLASEVLGVSLGSMGGGLKTRALGGWGKLEVEEVAGTLETLGWCLSQTGEGRSDCSVAEAEGIGRLNLRKPIISAWF